MAGITQHLWFESKAEEAARFYVSLLPGSRIDHVNTMPADSPSGPAGSVVVVEFTLMGVPYVALEAGPLDPFNHAYSIMVKCDDQAELDRLWNALLEGGTAEQCGWLRDKYGLCWQIVPTALDEMMRDKDRTRGKRVAEAMLKMVKMDIAGLQAAYDGKNA
jgi:predicted 3-demethylubiquinone-9 3-methyltransferase (glyoxalase superfamily)